MRTQQFLKMFLRLLTKLLSCFISVGSREGFDPVDVGTNVRCPLLVQTGDLDELVPVDVLKVLRETLELNSQIEEWKIEVFEGFGHAFAHHPSEEREQVQSEVAFGNMIAWLERHV